MKKEKKGDNLYLVTRDNGKAYWYFRGYANGRQVEKSLGPADLIGIRDAKRKVSALLNEKVRARIASRTFRDVMPEAIEDIALIKQWKNRRSYNQWYQSLRDYALPNLGDIPVSQITRDDILKTLRPIWLKMPETASRVQHRLESVFNWAITRGLRTDSNPAAWRGNLALFLPPKSKVAKVKHLEAPTLEELRRAVRYLLAHPSPASGCLLLTIASACRVSEARLATPEEIKKDVWTIPVEHQKVSSLGPRRVPLSSLAKAGVAMAGGGGKKYLFEAVKGRPLALDTPRMKLVMILPRETGDPVTVHGIRSLFRDWCAENGVPDAEAEKALGHTWGNAVTAAYYRTDLLEQRKELMQKWANALEL